MPKPTKPIPEPINSLGVLLAVADYVDGPNSGRYALKMDSSREPINTDTIFKLLQLLREDLRGSRWERLRDLVEQAHEDIYLKGGVERLPTGRLSMEDRSLLTFAIATHRKALREASQGADENR